MENFKMTPVCYLILRHVMKAVSGVCIWLERAFVYFIDIFEAVDSTVHVCIGVTDLLNSVVSCLIIKDHFFQFTLSYCEMFL